MPATVESATALSWTSAVAKETMRLRPVAPLLYHDTNVETVLDDIRLPADSRVALLMRVAARRERHFDDLQAFRHAAGRARRSAADARQFRTVSIGSRCLGPGLIVG